MNKFEITKEDFEKHCYSATHCNNNVFEAVLPQIEIVQDNFFRELGLDIVENTTSREDTLIVGAVCCRAYADTIPHLDLVLTGSGFGIVSTDNITPASADRVNRLRTRLLDVYDDAVDRLISSLRAHTEWRDTDIAKNIFSTFFWAGEHYRKAAFPDIYRRDCAKHRPLVSIAEAKLRGIVGDEMIDELLSAIRKNEISSLQTQLVTLIHGFISAEITETNVADSRQLVQTMLRFLDCHIDSFPTYKASSAYEARKCTKFENKKENPTYFF